MYTMSEPQLTFPSPAKLFTPGVTLILALLVIGFLIFGFSPHFTISFLAISSRSVFSGQLWQLVTYPFVESCPTNLVFTLLTVLFVGSAIEREWQTASFLLLWLFVTVTCGAIWVIVNLLAGQAFVGFGSSACVYGLIAALGMLFRGRAFFVLFATVRAEYLVMILIALGIILNVRTPLNLIWVLGALVAYFYIRLCWRIGGKRRRNIAARTPNRANSFVDID